MTGSEPATPASGRMSNSRNRPVVLTCMFVPSGRRGSRGLSVYWPWPYAPRSALRTARPNLHHPGSLAESIPQHRVVRAKSGQAIA